MRLFPVSDGKCGWDAENVTLTHSSVGWRSHGTEITFKIRMRKSLRLFNYFEFYVQYGPSSLQGRKTSSLSSRQSYWTMARELVRFPG
jgi:hypothetical protein